MNHVSSSDSVGSLDSASSSSSFCSGYTSSSAYTSLTSSASSCGSCLDRVSQVILFHQKDYSFEHVRSYFPPDTTGEEIKQCLEEDRRFSLNETEEGLFVGRANVAIADTRLQQAVERWKDQMSNYFRESHCDVKLCMLSQLVKRPSDVPKQVKLVDVLNSDLQRRFLLISSNNVGGMMNKKRAEDAVIKYKCTPHEVEEYHEQWRRNVVAFLLQQSHPVPLVAIGTHVVKPKNLGKNQKLIDVVKLDVLKRFHIHVDTSHNSLTRLSVTEEYSCEYWRQQIFRSLQNSQSNLLMDLDVSGAPRPACLPRSVTLRSVILSDPEQRFRYATDYPRLRRMHGQTKRPAPAPKNHFVQGVHQNRMFQPQDQYSPVPLSQPTYTSQNFPQHCGFQQPVQMQAARPQFHPSQKIVPSISNVVMRNGPAPQHNSHNYSHVDSHVGSVPPGFVSSQMMAASPFNGSNFSQPAVTPSNTKTQEFYKYTNIVAAPPLEKSVSAEFNNCAPSPNSSSFLNDSSSSCTPVSNSDGISAQVPASLLLERTVSSEFHEYSSIPGLLRFLSDAL